MMENKNVKILAKSRNKVTGDIITTFLLKRFPYTLIQEPATHRLLRWSSHCVSGDLNPFGETVSRSSASSRAIPIRKVVDRILEDPFIPTWTLKQKGMQGNFNIDALTVHKAEGAWVEDMHHAIERALYYDRIGIHKQHANDILKPFMRIPILVTGTEWDNFFNLRCNKDTVRPEFYEQAFDMREVYEETEAVDLDIGEWHIPFGDRIEGVDFQTKLKVATARDARLSYASHDGEISVERDVSLHDMLLKDIHMSPMEHSAKAVETNIDYGFQKVDGYILLTDSNRVVSTYNLRGFMSYRAHIEQSVPV